MFDLILSGLIFVGIYLFSTYAAYGIGYLPFQLVTCNKSHESKRKEFEDSESVIKEKIEFLQGKLRRKGNLSSSEQAKLDLLLEREK